MRPREVAPRGAAGACSRFMKESAGSTGLLQSGVIFSAVAFITGIGNYVFQAIFSRNLGSTGEYGLANTALSFGAFLGLPVAIATFAVTHYIARYNFAGDTTRLHGLLAGCRRFLFRLTLGGSVLAILLVKPLSLFFNFPRSSVVLAVLAFVLAGLWGAFATALCQGLSWFKRLALIGFVAMLFRLGFGGLITLKYPLAEMVVLASGVGLGANLLLLIWRKQLVARDPHPESPWNREFIQFIIVAAAYVFGGYCFTQGDLLVANRHLVGAQLDAYSAAGLLARALPMTVAPLLTVLFTHRSGQGSSDSLSEQLKLLCLYGGSLIGGACALYFFRELFLKVIARNTPEASGMILPLASTMVFTGLLQALALWGLASRWTRISILYGGLGATYWLALLSLGQTRENLLRVMPITAALAFVILLTAWIVAMRWSKSERANR